MLFSSPLFLYLFLPITLLGYYLMIPKLKNYWLLAASLVFFAWGGVTFTFILVGSILLNYIFGLWIQKQKTSGKGKLPLILGVSTNIAILAVFKYTNFLVLNLNQLLDWIHIPLIPQTHIILPIGISFYTFHSLSYLVDIYRNKAVAQRNFFDLSLYITMFSQLIAGPIIRYSDVDQQLRGRTHTLEKFSYGIERFLIGLGKKVLLANTFAKIADQIFATNPMDLSAPLAWLGIICYTLQIYCDFAGYSDMAIGLGRMFGFEFMENFNFPYIAKSVKEFWRRWHISLSSFFRDYVYIPLGGNKITISRTYINLLIVFFLTGFWHGSSWSFVVWGLFHGFFMVIERLWLGKLLDKTWKPIANFYTLLVVMFAWVLFRADSLGYAVDYWKAMFDFKTTSEQMILFRSYLDIEFYLTFGIAVLGSFGAYQLVSRYINKILNSTKIAAQTFAYGFHFVSVIFYILILYLSTMYLISGTYNPFIYYRF
ncbi:MAG: AlgI [Bacteroidetes bacterium]|nr:AlgI [Bacteroidota bacterium]